MTKLKNADEVKQFLHNCRLNTEIYVTEDVVTEIVGHIGPENTITVFCWHDGALSFCHDSDVEMVWRENLTLDEVKRLARGCL